MKQTEMDILYEIPVYTNARSKRHSWKGNIKPRSCTLSAKQWTDLNDY